MKNGSRSRNRISAVLPRISLALAAVAFSALATPSNKWRLEFDGKSKVNGEIELTVTPQGGAAATVVISVPAKTTENGAARLARDAISSVFGDVYHVEVDDGEDLLVRSKGSTPDFEIVVARNTVEGIRLELDRE